MSLEAIYASLWDTMQRDFESELDSETLEGFKQNVNYWAEEHDSEAVDAVALEVWAALHENEPILEVDTEIEFDTEGVLRNRGKFAGLTNIADLVAQNFSDDAIEASLDAIESELPTRLEIYRAEIHARAVARAALLEAEKAQRLQAREQATQAFIAANEAIQRQRAPRFQLPEFRLPRGRLGGEEPGQVSTIAPLSRAEKAELKGEEDEEKPKKKRDSKGRFLPES